MARVIAQREADHRVLGRDPVRMQGCLPCGAIARIAVAVRRHSLSCTLGRVATDSHSLLHLEGCGSGSGGGLLSCRHTHVSGSVVGALSTSLPAVGVKVSTAELRARSTASVVVPGACTGRS